MSLRNMNQKAALLVAIVGAVCIIGTAGTSQAAARPSLNKSRAASTTACRTPDGFANNFRSYASRVLTGTTTASAAMRQAWNVPATSDSEIVFVTDSATCAQAAFAHAVRAHTDTILPAAVYLIRAGSTRYIAFNGERVGEYLIHFVFDSTFQYLGSIGS